MHQNRDINSSQDPPRLSRWTLGLLLASDVKDGKVMVVPTKSKATRTSWLFFKRVPWCALWVSLKIFSTSYLDWLVISQDLFIYFVTLATFFLVLLRLSQQDPLRSSTVFQKLNKYVHWPGHLIFCLPLRTLRCLRSSRRKGCLCWIALDILEVFGGVKGNKPAAVERGLRFAWILEEINSKIL